MSTQITLKLTGGPNFLGGAVLEQDEEGYINIGVLKDNGTWYAYSRITKQDLERAVAIVTQPGFDTV